ncbi:MBL fold metallo-hydrolase [Streptomyces botrytidirepellens]|uniref:MBL fold metallo-hydrolase n=1 Tax=Streptomyces botrytidirepellens TaxID=2486417 RepID=A0A3M8SHB3_9ACTN|nr:MBL fold metallo-hydrolase [Streptomyces botrytidirepellens]RNF78220.1 MBL fold metallo-hydrolase [Streptomyces botrytidirepellens]
MEVTGARQERAWQQGVLPPVEEVRPGLWSIPVPFPRNPLRYVLVYAFALEDGVAIVDAGWDCDEAWEGLKSGLATAGYQISDVRTVLVTHLHPDHFGLVGRVRARSGARIAMHPADARLLRHRGRLDEEDYAHVSREQLRRAGCPRDLYTGQHAMPLVRFEACDGADDALHDGDRVDLPGWNLRAVWTPGHTPGHLCFVERDLGLLLSGDHVLPRITPTILLSPGHERDPLGSYAASLRKIADLDVDEVLPAHEWRFRGLRDRVHTMLRHHDDRLAEIEHAVRSAPGITAWQATERLTWSRPFQQMAQPSQRLALREILAHLVVLSELGRVRETGDPVAHWYPCPVSDGPLLVPQTTVKEFPR